VTETGASVRLAEHVSCDVEPLLGATPNPDVGDVLAWAWCDELLAGWYDDWVLDVREVLQVRRAVLLEDLATASARAGRVGDALLFAALAVAAQPLRESAHRVLLRAHLELGHHREATGLYSELGRILRHELAVEPSPETAALLAREPEVGEHVA
jgi:DNA-binding SARP family transcriptional activator